MVVLSLLQTEVVTSDKEAGSVQVEAAAMAGRDVHLLQQWRGVRNNESAFSPLARRRKDRGRRERGEAIVRGN